MSIDPTKTPARLLNIVHQFLTEQNQDPDIIWDYCNVTPSCLTDELSVVPLDSFLKSFELIEKYRNTDEPLSHIIQRLFPITYIGRFGYTVLAAPTVEDGLNVFFNYFHHATPLGACKSVSDNNDLCFKMIDFDIFRQYEQVMIEVGLFVVQNYLLLCNAPIESIQFHLKNYGSDIHLAKWSKYNICYQQDENKLVIDKSNLAKHSPLFDVNIYQTNIKRFQHYEKQLGQLGSISKRVQELINVTLQLGPKPTLIQIAEQFSCSDRQLSRHLKSENNTFQKILDECIAQRAQILLLSDRPLKCIALELGFSSVAGLNKTFYRYYGISLKDFKGERGFVNTFYQHAGR